MTVPRLIEVALPIREISAESVRDKSLRHGHISTLHLWFARRPLAASRAVVFASLVPDPDHPECPPAFREAVERHLKTHVPDVLRSYRRGRVVHLDPDPYRPYDGQPDTLRNRLLMFVAKWSPEWLAFEQGKSNKEPESKHILDDRCLVKWETCSPTYRSGTIQGAPNYITNDQGSKVLEIACDLTRLANGGRPIVLDPFSGGGSIPLEVGRLGGLPHANDYNPVAYLILRATCEYPQTFGKPGNRLAQQLTANSRLLFSTNDTVQVDNVLSHDVEFWAKEIIKIAEDKVGSLYPVGKDKLPVLGYIWARTMSCSNTSCRAEIPLISTLLLCNKPGKKVALAITVKGKDINFSIVKGKGIARTDGTMLNRGNCRCEVCKQPTSVRDIRQAGKDGKLGERLIAVIVESSRRVAFRGDDDEEGAVSGKDYRMPESQDYAAVELAKSLASRLERPAEAILPEITGRGEDEEDISNSTGIRVHLYGYRTWGHMFNPRQLIAIHSVLDGLHDVMARLATDILDPEYRQAVTSYLGLWLSRSVQHANNLCRWNAVGEKMQHIFGRQAISMIWDYVEVPPFAQTAGSPINLLRTTLDFLDATPVRENNQSPARVFLGDAAAIDIPSGSVDAVVTDPPYFDAIAYADLSDVFYVWLKRGVGVEFPQTFSTPLTPKSQEATALRHRHGGDWERAKAHFIRKLTEALTESKRVCKSDGVVTVMFAHQSNEAWIALVNSLFDAGLNITATYPIDTEKHTRMRAMNSCSLASSITVVCRPRIAIMPGSFKEVRRDIERVVKESVHRFWNYGFRGADLIVACYGPAVGEFGKYERVERGDGQVVTVPELLTLVRESALKAIAGEFTGDPLSRLYFVWANMYGVNEQPWDDVRLVVQMSGEAENAMDVATGRGLFVVDGSNSRLSVLADRAGRTHLGDDKASPLIDQLHRAMLFWKKEDRAGLVQYLHGHELADHTGFWKLAQALFEVMPRDAEDWKLVSALLGERNTLRTEIKRQDAALTAANAGLFDGHDG